MVIDKLEPSTQEDSLLLTVLQKTFALIVGPVYLYVIAEVFAWATATPFAKCLGLALCASAALIVIIACLSNRMKEDNVRFRLSTLLLVVTGLAVYFAPIGVMYRSLIAEGEPISFLFLGYSVVFVPFSTMILVYFMDSLLWFTCRIQRILSAVHR